MRTPSSSASTRSSSCTTSAGRSKAAPTPSTAPTIEAFHRLAARALAERGWARLYLMHVEGAAARRALRLASRRSLRLLPGRLRSRVAPALRRHRAARPRRPRLLRRRRSSEFDFLRGTEPYKLKWANGWRETVRLRARDASLRALLHDAGRTALLATARGGQARAAAVERSSGRAAPAERSRDDHAR